MIKYLPEPTLAAITWLNDFLSDVISHIVMEEFWPAPPTALLLESLAQPSWMFSLVNDPSYCRLMDEFGNNLIIRPRLMGSNNCTVKIITDIFTPGSVRLNDRNLSFWAYFLSVPIGGERKCSAIYHRAARKRHTWWKWRLVTECHRLFWRRARWMQIVGKWGGKQSYIWENTAAFSCILVGHAIRQKAWKFKAY